MRANEEDGSPDVLSDAQIVADCIASGKPIPPEIVSRVQDRSKKIKKEIFERFGVQNIGVDILRELRGDLPEP